MEVAIESPSGLSGIVCRADSPFRRCSFSLPSCLERSLSMMFGVVSVLCWIVSYPSSITTGFFDHHSPFSINLSIRSTHSRLFSSSFSSFSSLVRCFCLSTSCEPSPSPLQILHELARVSSSTVSCSSGSKGGWGPVQGSSRLSAEGSGKMELNCSGARGIGDAGGWKDEDGKRGD